jgi:hypothetical protein
MAIPISTKNIPSTSSAGFCRLCGSVGPTKPLHRLMRRAEIQLIQPHLLINDRIAGVPEVPSSSGTRLANNP